mmetsp:Transcript_130386/g.251236  ORF Transcript_130386/g.251236 Transcript_130386/m.251236 type:complete len:395 (-) Transcript_130386:2-1186(-)
MRHARLKLILGDEAFQVLPVVTTAELTPALAPTSSLRSAPAAVPALAAASSLRSAPAAALAARIAATSTATAAVLAALIATLAVRLCGPRLAARRAFTVGRLPSLLPSSPSSPTAALATTASTAISASATAARATTTSASLSVTITVTAVPVFTTISGVISSAGSPTTRPSLVFSRLIPVFFIPSVILGPACISLSLPNLRHDEAAGISAFIREWDFHDLHNIARMHILHDSADSIVQVVVVNEVCNLLSEPPNPSIQAAVAVIARAPRAAGGRGLLPLVVLALGRGARGAPTSSAATVVTLVWLASICTVVMPLAILLFPVVLCKEAQRICCLLVIRHADQAQACPTSGSQQIEDGQCDTDFLIQAQQECASYGTINFLFHWDLEEDSSLPCT